MKVSKIVLLVIVVSSIVALAVFYKIYSNNFKKIKIGEADVFVEIADNPKEREEGLSGRKNLKENRGMLFIFENSGYHSFWMKNMLMSLDFIWIKDKRVTEVTENVQPEDYQPPKTLIPEKETNMVLEVNAGFVEKNDIKMGDEIKY